VSRYCLTLGEGYAQRPPFSQLEGCTLPRGLLPSLFDLVDKPAMNEQSMTACRTCTDQSVYQAGCTGPYIAQVGTGKHIARVGIGGVYIAQGGSLGRVMLYEPREALWAELTLPPPPSEPRRPPSSLRLPVNPAWCVGYSSLRYGVPGRVREDSAQRPLLLPVSPLSVSSGHY